MFCSKCGKRVPEQGPFCSTCGMRLVGESAPCPKCGNTLAGRSDYTWWGGLLGPRLLNHVKCLACGTTYNGRTGKSNTTAIIVYQVVGVVLVLITSGLAFWWLYSVLF